jgi:hypothetical protein
VEQYGSYLADDDCVTLARQYFFDDAINASKRIFENCRAVIRQPDPCDPAISVLALQASATSKLVGEHSMVCANDIHSEIRAPLQLPPRRRVLIDSQEDKSCLSCS